MRYFRLLLPVAFLLLACGLRARADEASGRRADPEGAKAYEREALLKEARRAMSGEGAGEAVLTAMRRGLAADIEFLEGYEAAPDEDPLLRTEFQNTIDERVLLVGKPSEREGEGGEVGTFGALYEATVLIMWLRGEAPCHVVVRDEGDTGKKERWWPFPYEHVPASEHAPGPASDPDAAAGHAPDAEAEPAAEPAAEDAAPATEGEAPDATEEEAPDTPPQPLAAEDFDTWAKMVVHSKEEGGALRGKVISPAVCGAVTNLQRAAAQPPAYIHPEVRRLVRHALIAEDVFAYNLPYVALRTLQATERNTAMQSDKPPASLVDEAMVREKVQVAAGYRKGVAEYEALKKRVLAELDKMVGDLDNWKAQAALLAQEIEDARREAEALAAAEAAAEQEAAAEASDDGEVPDDGKEADTEGAHEVEEAEVAPTSFRLRLAAARETLVSLDITLTYLTALRAEVRLELLDRLLLAATDEATAAEQVQSHYENALLKLRNARRLDRLLSDERTLDRWIQQEEGKDLVEGSIGAARLDAYSAVLAVNRIVQEAVLRRKAVAPGGTVESPEAAILNEGSSADDELDASTPAHLRLSSVVRTPRKASWDVKYVEIAQTALADPDLREAFDARLVAEHYAAVDDRIRALVEASQLAHDDAQLAERFASAYAEAETELEPLHGDGVVQVARRLPAKLAAAKEDFEAAMTGITEQRHYNRERLQALVAYHGRLLEQGTRSLLIRTNRELWGADLDDALADTTEAFGAAQRWALLEGEDHIGRFIEQKWVRVLALIVFALAALWLVHLGRRRVDAWIEKAAARHPALRRAGASVREETEEARRRRVEDDEAAAVTNEATILLQVSEEEVTEESEESKSTEAESKEAAR